MNVIYMKEFETKNNKLKPWKKKKLYQLSFMIL